jgi:type IV pilus assembly protein PilB
MIFGYAAARPEADGRGNAVEPPPSSLSGVPGCSSTPASSAPRRREELPRARASARPASSRPWSPPARSSPDDLAHTLSAALALPLLDLNAVDMQKLPRNLVDQKIATQYQLMVLGKRGNRLFIGAADPTDQEAVERIKFATQLTPEWVIVEYDKLMRQLEKPGHQRQRGAGVPGQFRLRLRRHRRRHGAAESADVTTEVEDAPVVRFLQKMLIDAINMRASDLHFEPYEYHYRVRFRIDGELREITQPPMAIKDKLASRIKVISRMDIAEKRVPQDGRMKLKFGTKAIDFRVSTCPRCSARRS